MPSNRTVNRLRRMPIWAVVVALVAAMAQLEGPRAGKQESSTPRAPRDVTPAAGDPSVPSAAAVLDANAPAAEQPPTF